MDSRGAHMGHRWMLGSQLDFGSSPSRRDPGVGRGWHYGRRRAHQRLCLCSKAS